MHSTQAQAHGFRSPDRWNSVPIPERVAQRAYDRVKVGDDGCWISTYSVGSHGYAQIGWQDGDKVRMVLAHRAAWTHINGQMPVGVTLDHTCKTRRCVNPSHLRILPNYENARRVSGMDWPMGQCANGHPNSEIRTRVVKRPGRPDRVGVICRLCRSIYIGRSNWRTRHPGEPMPERLWIQSDMSAYMCEPDCGFEGEVHTEDGRGRCPQCARAVAGLNSKDANGSMK